MSSHTPRQLFNFFVNPSLTFYFLCSVHHSRSYTQANMLLRDEADKIAADAPHYWLTHNTPYVFPHNRWVPFMYSSPLDTFFPLSLPTYLSFPNRTPNTRRATPINPTCLWTSPDETAVFCVGKRNTLLISCFLLCFLFGARFAF